MLVISFDAQRRFYVSTEEVLQAFMLERVAAHHGICITSQQLYKAAYLPYVSLPSTHLPAYLDMTAQQRWAVPQLGIPAAATNNELLEYIEAFQSVAQQQYSRKGFIYLRLDAQTSAVDVRALFLLLQSQSITRYHLVVERARYI